MTMHTPITSSATVRSGLGIFAFGLLTAAILSACGGGDGVYAPSPNTVSISNTTYITSSSLATPTALVTAGTLRYMVQGFLGADAVSIQGTTTAAALVYGTHNAVIGLDNHSLAATNGTYAVQEFMGDTTFAQGRWTKGLPTINNVVSTTPLTGTNTAALHYLITRDMTAFPANGTYPCGTNVRSTGLTYSGNNGGFIPNDTMLVGALLPDATITISGASATLYVDSIAVYAGVRPEFEPAHTLTFTLPSDGPKYTGDYNNLSGGEGIAYVLGEGPAPAANKITLGIAFRRTMTSGPRYKGMASVVCTKT